MPKVAENPQEPKCRRECRSKACFLVEGSRVILIGYTRFIPTGSLWFGCMWQVIVDSQKANKLGLVTSWLFVYIWCPLYFPVLLVCV